MYLIKYLESQGHTCRIYFYDGLEQSSLAEITKNMKNHVAIEAELFYNQADMLPADAVFATGWTTAASQASGTSRIPSSPPRALRSGTSCNRTGS